MAHTEDMTWHGGGKQQQGRLNEFHLGGGGGGWFGLWMVGESGENKSWMINFAGNPRAHIVKALESSIIIQ